MLKTLLGWFRWGKTPAPTLPVDSAANPFPFPHSAPSSMYRLDRQDVVVPFAPSIGPVTTVGDEPTCVADPPRVDLSGFAGVVEFVDASILKPQRGPRDLLLVVLPGNWIVDLEWQFAKRVYQVSLYADGWRRLVKRENATNPIDALAIAKRFSHVPDPDAETVSFPRPRIANPPPLSPGAADCAGGFLSPLDVE